MNRILVLVLISLMLGLPAQAAMKEAAADKKSEVSEVIKPKVRSEAEVKKLAETRKLIEVSTNARNLDSNGFREFVR